MESADQLPTLKENLPKAGGQQRFPGMFLLAAVFVIAVCGLMYELIAAALSTYLLGSSVTHFSLVIGVFLTAMGVGSYLTRYFQRDLAELFIGIQIGIGLSGGISAAVLLFSFAVLESYLPILFLVLGVTGVLVGMEIPLLIRILKSQSALRITVSNVLTLDYIGALVASCLFPLLFVPYVGLLRTSYLFGLLNVAVALVGLRVMRHMIRKRKPLVWSALGCALLLTGGLFSANRFTSLTESLLYRDEIILVRQTPYQRLVVTRWRNDTRLFIDGHLQFSSVDEHRYHETLVHPAAAACPGARRALILGGGDGMAARELLKYPSIERIDLVDLDEEMIRLFRDHPFLASLCENALSDSRLHLHVNDAGKFLEQTTDMWDLVYIDLPDPHTFSLSRLYTTSFYRLLSRRLNWHGIVVTQATSPFYASKAFWCIVETWRQTPVGPEEQGRFHVYPYHAYVPSFGDWGFVMASFRELQPTQLKLASGVPLRFITQDVLPTLFVFPFDSMLNSEVKPNRLDDQVLPRYYRDGWRRYGP